LTTYLILSNHQKLDNTLSLNNISNASVKIHALEVIIHFMTLLSGFCTKEDIININIISTIKYELAVRIKKITIMKTQYIQKKEEEDERRNRDKLNTDGFEQQFLNKMLERFNDVSKLEKELKDLSDVNENEIMYNIIASIQQKPLLQLLNVFKQIIQKIELFDQIQNKNTILKIKEYITKYIIHIKNRLEQLEPKLSLSPKPGKSLHGSLSSTHVSISSREPDIGHTYKLKNNDTECIVLEPTQPIRHDFVKVRMGNIELELPKNMLT